MLNQYETDPNLLWSHASRHGPYRHPFLRRPAFARRHGVAVPCRRGPETLLRPDSRPMGLHSTHNSAFPQLTHHAPFRVDTSDPTLPSLAKAPAILTDYLGVPVTALDPSGTTTVGEGLPVDLTVTVEASQPALVRWSSNGVAIANANLLTY